MALRDFFATGIKKHAARAKNKRAQNADRWDSIEKLSRMGTEEAISALLMRFTFRMDPSIIDHQEKDLAFQGILRSGQTAVEPVRKFMRTAESVSWPMKILDRLLGPEEVVGELLAMLLTFDTDYERDPERKIQVLSYLEDHDDERIAEEAARFLEDMNETVRFHAAGAVLEQKNAEIVLESLVKAVIGEESMRVRARILDGFSEHEWPIAEDQVAEVQPQLPQGYAVDATRIVRKK